MVDNYLVCIQEKHDFGYNGRINLHQVLIFICYHFWFYSSLSEEHYDWVMVKFLPEIKCVELVWEQLTIFPALN